jgi:hypothetical protein
MPFQKNIFQPFADQIKSSYLRETIPLKYRDNKINKANRGTLYKKTATAGVAVFLYK